jgi:hypothetical protein
MNKLIAFAFVAAVTTPLMGVTPILSAAAGFQDMTEPAARYDLDGAIEIPVSANELAECRATLESVFIGGGTPEVRCVVTG